MFLSCCFLNRPCPHLIASHLIYPALVGHQREESTGGGLSSWGHAVGDVGATEKAKRCLPRASPSVSSPPSGQGETGGVSPSLRRILLRSGDLNWPIPQNTGIGKNEVTGDTWESWFHRMEWFSEGSGLGAEDWECVLQRGAIVAVRDSTHTSIGHLPNACSVSGARGEGDFMSPLCCLNLAKRVWLALTPTWFAHYFHPPMWDQNQPPKQNPGKNKSSWWRKKMTTLIVPNLVWSQKLSKVGPD
jgi:hypothetical protein